MGYNAIEELRGEKFEEWRWGNHPGFFRYLQGDTEVGIIERAQFILFYLEQEYGEEIHKDFVKMWNSENKALLIDAGFDDKESVIVLYSYLAGENLANLFEVAGFDITEERVNEGLLMLGNRVEKRDGDNIELFGKTWVWQYALFALSYSR